MARFSRWWDARRSRVWLDDYDGGHWHYPAEPVRATVVPSPREEALDVSVEQQHDAAVG